MQTIETTHMNEKPLIQRPSKEELFTDRDEFLDAFEGALTDLTPDAPKVLVFHGPPGIGKTAIREELIRNLERRTAKYSGCDQEHIYEDERDYYLAWAKLNFVTPEYITPRKALINIRYLLAEHRLWKVPFKTFDIGYAVHWRKIKPELNLDLNNFKVFGDNELIGEIAEGIGLAPGFSLIANVAKAASKLKGAWERWWVSRGAELLQGIEDLEAYNIETEVLPVLFGRDLSGFAADTGVKTVIFLDTYEGLWPTRTERGAHKYAFVDNWVRETVAASKGVLWVITGHEKLVWGEVDDSGMGWEETIDDMEVVSLTEKDCYKLLDRAAVEEKALKEHIYKGSRGVPIYIDLSTITYHKIKTKGEEPTPEDFPKAYEEIVNVFTRRLDQEEAETLYVLSAARVFDQDLFSTLINHFSTSYPVTAFNDFVRFAFIVNTGKEGEYYVHELLSEHLADSKNKHIRDRVLDAHRFLFEHYRSVADIDDPKAITEENVRALGEAVYHGLGSGDAEGTVEWFCINYRPYDDAALYGELEALYVELIDEAEPVLGPEHMYLAAALNNLAKLYVDQGRYDEAEPLYLRGLEITEKALGLDHPSVATTLNNLAELYRAQGRYPEAEPLYLRDLKITEKAFGPDHPSVATTLNNLALLYLTQGRYPEAEPLYVRSLEITEKALGPDHLDIATVLNNLAGFYQTQGRLDEAEPLYKRALNIREEKLGPDHPGLASALNNLGELYKAQGCYDEAELLYERSIDIAGKALGPDHPSVGTTLNNLAGLYSTQGRYPEAEPLYVRSLEITEKTLGPDHPNVAYPLNNLGSLFYDTDRKEEAVEYFERGLQLFIGALPPDHPNIITVLENLSVIYNEIGESEKAAEYARRAEALKQSREEGEEEPPE